MATVTVSGKLSDFELEPIAGLSPEIEFLPSEPAVGNGGRLLATKAIRVPPEANGDFTVQLHTTDDLLPSNVYYQIVIRWLDGNGRFIKADNPNWKLQVPAGGGAIADLIRLPLGTGIVIYSPTEPPIWAGLLGAIWFQLDPNDANNPSNPANTGDIYQVRDA
ncbi:hypothetical protein [Arthrobacter sp. D5-1]|uniref:hypothetical protein n=1 Tax=Arthrobacter sp. D5-1 TaxID=1477518 RepID=UPI001A992B58|nr:hypothetical protein [Arthrobacter sp. D5-1]QSZ49418.1 hypothetical protein AYX22_14095 [Arthrobacter sp. D5-1]